MGIFAPTCVIVIIDKDALTIIPTINAIGPCAPTVSNALGRETKSKNKKTQAMQAPANE